MKSSYLCPKCKGHLKVGDNVIFSTKTKNKEVGLILLNTKLGDYKYINHPSYKFNEGELIEFLCPICHSNLVASDIHNNLAKILTIDEQDNVYEILFSMVAGEKCTFKMKLSKVEEYGEHTSRYKHYLRFFR